MVKIIIENRVVAGYMLFHAWKGANFDGGRLATLSF